MITKRKYIFDIRLARSRLHPSVTAKAISFAICSISVKKVGHSLKQKIGDKLKFSAIRFVESMDMYWNRLSLEIYDLEF